MGKVYVKDYQPVPRKADDSGFQQWTVEYVETPEGAATVANEDIANSECKNLNSYNVKVNSHLCVFNVERLATGKFAFVCENHL